MKKYLILSLLMLTSAASAIPEVSIQTGALPTGETKLTFARAHAGGHYDVVLQHNKLVTKNLPWAPAGVFVADPHGNVEFCTREDGTAATPADFSVPHFSLNITHNPHNGEVFCALTKGG